MKKAFKLVIAVLGLFTLYLVVLKSVFYLEAMSRRNQAERILEAVVRLQPGATRVVDLQRDVFPLDSQFMSGCASGTANAAIFNLPAWDQHSSKILAIIVAPAAFNRSIERLVLPKWTMFSVSLSCDSGILTSLKITEMQESGWVHPYSDTIYSLPKGTVADADSGDPKPQCRNYWVFERKMGEYADDKLVRESPILNRFIYITPDATEDQRRRAFDFGLDCFTRLGGCQNVDLILPAAPNSK